MSNNEQVLLTQDPWYRQFWPWFLISLPLAAVLGGIATIWIAVTTADGLVVDDYYRQGLAINQTIERDKKAAELGVSTLVQLDTQRGKIQIQLSSTQAIPNLQVLKLQLLHPTQDNHDIQRTLQKGGQGFIGELPEVIPDANWHILIEPESLDWRIAGRIRLPDEASVMLGEKKAISE